MPIINARHFQFDFYLSIYYTFESTVKQERNTLCMHASLVNNTDSDSLIP